MLPEDLRAHALELDITLSEQQARRVFAHVVGRGQPLATLPRLAAGVRSRLGACTKRRDLELVEQSEDTDGFVKFLLRSEDGALSEAVRIPLERSGRYSVCLSSQVGCAMRCDFCATGRLGLSRNLEAWEMVSAFDIVRKYTPQGRISSAVFMGQGEPFQNYDHVIQAARILSHPNGGAVTQESITISTVGLIPAMRRFTAEGHRFRLIVSLHSADESKRRRLLPVAGRQSLDELVSAVARHAEATGKPVTLAWTLMGGVNDDVSEVAALRQRFAGTPVVINLIDVNDARPDGYRRSTREALEAFRDALAEAGLPMRRRYSGGANEHAACGMLAAKARSRARPASAPAAARKQRNAQ